MNQVIGLIYGLVLFLCAILSYILGYKHCKQLSQGIIPKVNLNPLKAITEIKETKKSKEEKEKARLAYEGWHGEKGILNYDPFNVKKEDE